MTLHKRLQHAALFVAAFAAITFGSLNVFAARIPLGALTTVNTSTHLDPMFVDLYDLREQITTPGYTGSAPLVAIGSATAALEIPGANTSGALESGEHLLALRNSSTLASARGAALRFFKGTSTTSGAAQIALVNGSSTNEGGLAFSTRNSAGTLADRVSMTSAGDLLIVSSGGIGYGAGSGGAVTQATNKSTAVTLNKTNGQITMNAAALAAGARVSFQVVNSLVGSTDVVVVSSFDNNLNYELQTTITAGGGSFYVTVKNATGGSLSEALVINFAVIKAATS